MGHRAQGGFPSPQGHSVPPSLAPALVSTIKSRPGGLLPRGKFLEPVRVLQSSEIAVEELVKLVELELRAVRAVYAREDLLRVQYPV